MLIIAVIPILLMIDHTLSRFDGLLLLIMFFIYVYILMKNKIPTYILGQDLKQLENVLKKKPFRGTLIEG